MASREVLELIIKARDEATRDLEQTNAALGRLGETVGTIGVVVGSAMIVRAAWDLGQLAGAAGRVENSFRGMVGAGADEMLDKLRAASRGTIDDMSLMLSANRAMMLGVTQNADEMARLLEVAAVRGQAMGLTTRQAFDDMMTGIGRASPLILDNLGIVTGGQKVYEDYAKAIGKATDALTEQEKKQALVSLVLNQGEGMQFTADDAASWEQLSASLANLKVSLGELVNETLGLPKAVELVAQAIGKFNELMDEGQSRQQAATEWAERYRIALQQQADAGQINAAMLDYQKAMIWAFEQATKAGVISLAQMQHQVWLMNPALALMSRNIKTEADLARDAAAANDGLAGSLNGVAAAALTTADALAAVSPEQAAFNLALLRQRMRQEENAQRSEVDRWLQGREAERQAANRERLEAEASLTPGRSGGGISDAQRQAEEWARTVKSAVESVFTTTQVTERDWWETNLGLYQDKPDEYLRRLRSAATEADSEWKHLLGGRTGDAANLYLAQQEELWRSGQWSQMGEGFDMGAAREAMVQAALAKLEAERAREAMIADIMSDPRLGGYSAGAREKVLGMGSEAGGATYAEAWVVGAVSVDAGKEFTDAFGAQMQAQEARWRVFGSLSAGWMIDGMSDAAGHAANALVDVLFPGIYEELRRAGVVATP